MTVLVTLGVAIMHSQGLCHKGIYIQLEKMRKEKLVFIEPEIMNQGLGVTFIT